MDLNLLYQQHQRSLMRAGATPSRLAQTRHLAMAGALANRIRNYQLGLGANAAQDWQHALDRLERYSDDLRGLSAL